MASEMAQSVKADAAKPDNLSSIPEHTHSLKQKPTTTKNLTPTSRPDLYMHAEYKHKYVYRYKQM